MISPLSSSTASTSSLSPLASTLSRRSGACGPCRASKQRCDRSVPCSTCVKKKTPERCTTSEMDARRTSAIVAKKREENENRDLRDEVDRLQKLVNVLVEARLETFPSPRPSTESTPFTPNSPPSVSPDDDITERLFSMTISPFSTAHPYSSESGIKRVQLIDEVEKQLEEIPHSTNPKPASSSFPFLRGAAPSLEEIMSHLPTVEGSSLKENFYWGCTSWFFHPIPEYIYERLKEMVYTCVVEKRVADPVALAVVFAVLGIGSNCQVTYTVTGGSQAELETAREWIELSAAALSHSNFLERPTLDAVRVLSLLAIFHLSIAPGDEGNLGFALTGLAVQACLQLKLHRDPSQVAVSFSFREAEERRSLIHHIYLLDGICSCSYSRGYILLHARDISAAFPLDLDDHELEFAEGPPERLSQETVHSSLIERFKLSRFSEHVTQDLLSSSLSYNRVLELDRQLESLCASINPLYRWERLPLLDLSIAANELQAWRISIVWITVWREKLRLHRPFLRRSYSDASFSYSRQACINASKGLLEIHSCPANLIPAAGFTHKASLACIILALELVFDKDGVASGEYRDLIDGALSRLDKFSQISIIARRGVKIVRFLLEKADESPSPRPAKRRRASSFVSQLPLDTSALSSSPISPTLPSPEESGTSTSKDYLQNSLTSVDSGPALTKPLSDSELFTEFDLAPDPLPDDYFAPSSSLIDPAPFASSGESFSASDEGEFWIPHDLLALLDSHSTSDLETNTSSDSAANGLVSF